VEWDKEVVRVSRVLYGGCGEARRDEFGGRKSYRVTIVLL